MSSHQRLRLANFFERLATVGVSCDEWSHYMATHYQDPAMEQARHSVAKLTLHYPFEEIFISNSKWLKLKTGDTETCYQIQSIAANICNAEKELKALIKEEWWIDWYILDNDRFVDVTWAKIQVFSDLSAEVFNMDGRTMYFENEASAANELSEDDYRRLANLDEEDEQDLGISLNELKPPFIYDKQELKPLMKVRFLRKL
jgi:hypothetical protein